MDEGVRQVFYHCLSKRSNANLFFTGQNKFLNRDESYTDQVSDWKKHRVNFLGNNLFICQRDSGANTEEDRMRMSEVKF